MTTIRAPSRLRSGGRVPRAVAELAVPALTVAFGLQLLRLMVSTVVGVYRDRLGAPLAALALFSFAVVGLGLLAAPVARLLGRGRALVLSVVGVALVRLVVQLVPDAVLRWLLAPVGVVLFLWAVPLWLARGGDGFGLALLVGLALDTALHGLSGSWDYAWSPDPWPATLAALLTAVTFWFLASAGLWTARGAPAAGGVASPTGGPGTGGSGSGAAMAGSGAALAALALVGIGPALFLHGLAWQNLGWQAVLGNRSAAGAFVVVMLANLGALAAGTAVARAGRVGWPVVGGAVVALAVAVAMGERAATPACLLGQAAAGVLLVRITRPGAGSLPDRRAGTGSFGGVVAAWTGGMLLFVLLLLGYYAAYDLVLPVGNAVVPALAAGLLGLAGLAAQRAAGRSWQPPVPVGEPGLAPAPALERSPRPAALVPLLVGVALLGAPAFAWLSAPDPVGAAPDPDAGPGRTVRVLSYNLHFGFDVDGWSDLEATARAIERSGAEVVGLQEVSRGWYVNGSTDMLAWLQARLRMPYARFAGASDAVWGNAVLSRHPIVGDGVASLPREGVPLRRNALWVELDLGGGRRLRVVVTHLHHLDGPAGARVRQAQVPRLLEQVGGRPATVLVGDLNAEPGTREIAMLRQAGLVDAFVAGGGGPADAPTWPADRPARRIDYIWLSPDLVASGFAAIAGTASDHRGVAVTVGPVS